MRVPGFVKEVVWSVYPPRYRQIADKPFSGSLWYLSKVLFFAFIIAGLLFAPKLFMLKNSIESELSKFETFGISGNVTQTAPIAVPARNPWVVVDLNSDLNISKEIFVIDKETVKYRFINTKSISREHLKNAGSNRAAAGGFFASVLVMLLPGIALFLYIRMWIKYFLYVLVFGTVFFIIMELSRYRLRWKQMLNISAHALTIVIFVEVVSAVFTAVYLLPVLRFLGLNIYAITTGLFAGLIVLGIVGYYIGDYKRKR
ncbi:DUF1189 domain-containing protein [Candidatus Woesearchaeota archaeon]|nr:DUF1189 domain-containing protein [Candidatus Woesearchaeota archaeon]MBW3016701.1 DUF1189 domain-containing protein [Candidatus Woesearchaeota archaeon]